MRDIEINWTDRGLEVLFDGWPSPRCERYLRNTRRVFRWLRRAGRVFIIGPAQVFGLAILFALMDGSLHVGADAANNLHRLRLVVDVNPPRHSRAVRCADGTAPVQSTVLCVGHGDVQAKQADHMLRRLQLLYLAGVWFGLEALFRERRLVRRGG